MTRVHELRELEEDALVERLESLKEELFNLRFQLATGQLDNPMRIKAVRHDVARILTILRERDIELELDELEAALAAPDAGSRSEAVAPGGDVASRRRRRKEENPDE